MQNYFELFDVEPQYQLDLHQLAERYRNLQRLYHPDRFAGKSAQEIRVSVQKASWVNQAYDVLKSPVLRAQYLLQLAGVDDSTDNHVTRDTAFLMKQMSMREELQEAEAAADPFAALELLAEEAKQDFQSLQEEFSRQFKGGAYPEAKEVFAKMQFFAKFLHEIEELEEELDS